MQPFLVGIAIKPERRKPTLPLTCARLTEKKGLVGSIGGWRRRRQIVVHSLDQWLKACVEAGQYADWHMRRGQLCVAGMSFGPESMGRTLLVGNLVLEVTGECEPCKRMDDVLPGLKKALTPEWRGGVTCKVLEGAVVVLGDTVAFAIKSP